MLSGGTPIETGDFVTEPGCLQALQDLAADAHNEQAWQVLWELEQERCFGIAYSILRSADRADDAIQNALLYVREHAADFDAARTQNPEAACRAWLHRIVTNSALQLIRSDQRHGQRNQTHGGNMHQQHNADPADTIAQHDLLQAIQDHQTQLSDAHQSSLALFFGAGLSYDETATAMECTVNNARVRVHRALKALRHVLSKAGISCSVWSISNALSAQEIPLHLSTIDVAQLPSDLSAQGVLGTSLPTGGLSIMAKLTLTAALAGALSFGAFSFNTADGADSQPAPQQRELSKKHVQAGKQWVAALLNMNAPNVLSASQTPFILDGKKELQTETELKTVVESIIEKKGEGFARYVVSDAAIASAETTTRLTTFIEKRSKGMFSVPKHTVFVEVTLGSSTGEEIGDNKIIAFIDPKTSKCFGFTDY